MPSGRILKFSFLFFVFFSLDYSLGMLQGLCLGDSQVAWDNRLAES